MTIKDEIIQQVVRDAENVARQAKLSAEAVAVAEWAADQAETVASKSSSCSDAWVADNTKRAAREARSEAHHAEDLHSEIQYSGIHPAVAEESSQMVVAAARRALWWAAWAAAQAASDDGHANAEDFAKKVRELAEQYKENGKRR